MVRNGRHHRIGKRPLWLGFISSALVMAACGDAAAGGGAGSSSAGNPQTLARAQAAVAAMKAVPQYKGPTAPLDISKVRGKTVYYVAFDLSNKFNNTLEQTFEEAANLMGIKTVALSGKVNPALENTYVEQAVKQHADAIVLLSIGHEQIPNALADAKAAGIPVISIAQYSGGTQLPSDITNQVTANTFHIGEVQADLAYTLSNGYINAIGYGGQELPQDVSQWKGQQSEVNALCASTCQYKSQAVNLTDFQTTLPNTTRAAIIADSKLNWFFPDWDILGTYAVVGIKAANAQSRVRYSTWNGIDAAMAAVKGGDEAGTFAVPLRWWGWATADMTARYIAGLPAPDEQVPARLFTKDVLDPLSSTSDETILYNDSKVFDTYKQLWGVS